MTIKREDLDRGRVDFRGLDIVAQLPPSHPGEILKDMFLEECGLSVYAAAEGMNLPRSRLNEIVLGKRNITAETALCLGKFFGNGPQFWLNLQNNYDLAMARKNDAVLERMKAVHRHLHLTPKSLPKVAARAQPRPAFAGKLQAGPRDIDVLMRHKDALFREVQTLLAEMAAATQQIERAARHGRDKKVKRRAA